MRTVLGLVSLALLGSLFATAPAHAAATCTTTTACGLNGTADGLQVALDGVAGGPCYQQISAPFGEATLRAHFWIKPLSLANGGVKKVWTVFSGHNVGDGVAIFRIDAHHLPGGAVRLRMICRQDDGTYARTALLTISNTTPGVEREIVMEWANGAGTGFCRMTRQGNGSTLMDEVLSLDNDSFSVIRTRLGAVVGIDEGETGAYCLDELRQFR